MNEEDQPAKTWQPLGNVEMYWPHEEIDCSTVVKKKARTATLFNQLAESIAILAFVSGGIPSLFGRRFEAEAMLAGFIGNEQAQAYCQHVRTPSNDDPTLDGKKME